MDRDILSNSPDSFLDAPQIKIEFPKVMRPDGESNVCVQLTTQGKDEFHLLSALSALCTSNQVITSRHRIAMLIIAPGRSSPMRLGYCDELTANTIVLRLCRNSGTDCTVSRDYGLDKQRILTDEDLDKRFFRF